MDTEQAFLSNIRANPTDDLPREVYADWLDEQAGGYSPRAEFIRVQVELARMPTEMKTAGPVIERCERLMKREQELMGHPGYSRLAEWLMADAPICCERKVFSGEFGYGWRLGTSPISVTYRRGFISEVRCTLVDWIGGECRTCEGRGTVLQHREYDPVLRFCPDCNRRPVTRGIGPQIVAVHPVAIVVMTDREPSRSSWTDRGKGGEEWSWHREVGPLTTVADSSVLPVVVYNLLGRDTFAFRQEAIDELSTAIIAWAKSQPV